MRFWIERRYAAWVVPAMRSNALASRRDLLRLPQRRAELMLLVLWLVAMFSQLFRGGPSNPFIVGALAVVVVLILALAAFRLLGSCFPSTSVAAFMLTTGCTLDEVPADASARSRAVDGEWLRRIGPVAAASRHDLQEANRRDTVLFLCASRTILVLVTLSAITLDSALGALQVVVLALGILVTAWSRREVRRRSVPFLADLADVFGTPLPPGPPVDPARFRTWVASTAVGGRTPA